MKATLIFGGIIALAIIAGFAAVTAPGISEPQEYTACGCGCCAGVEPRTECLYREEGGSMQAIMLQDQRIRESPDCETMGCSFPVRYIYCERP